MNSSLMTTYKLICARILARLDAAAIRGKQTRAAACLNMLAGAVFAADQLGDADTANRLTMLATLVSVRGESIIRDVAEESKVSEEIS